jgi:tripartite-type tricarboxylate transporter receptor subunit TctC
MVSAAFRAGFALFFGACLPGFSNAQTDPPKSYPTRPVYVVVGNPAGGGTDIITRMVTPKLAEAMGQPFVVDNKPGAFGNIAAEFVARARPDGYTLMSGTIGQLVINPVTYSKLPYSPRDFVPISLIATFPLIMVVDASQPVRSVQELVAFAKANPRKSNYAATGAPFQLAVEMFKIKTGVQLEYIPYKSEQELVTSVLRGDTLVTYLNAAPILGQIKAGKLRGLAVTNPTRVALFPDIPTMTEIGFPELETRFWFGFFAPTGTPTLIVKRMESEINRVVRMPEVKQSMESALVDATGSTSEELAQVIATEIPRWESVRKVSNIKLQE